MMHVTRVVSLIAVLMSAWVSFAADSPSAPSSLKIANAWVRPPIPGQNVGSAYMDITSAQNAVLVAVGSPVAARAELHTTTTEGNVMKMRPLEKLELRAGQTVTLAPGGMHVMLFDMKRPLKPGERVPLTLSLQPVGGAAGMALTTVTIEADVRPPFSGAHKH